MTTRTVAGGAAAMLVLAAGLTACGGAEVGRSDAKTAAVRAWLPALVVAKVGTEGDSGCVPALAAELVIEGEALRGVVVSDVVIGHCVVMVSQNKRFYELAPRSDDCGSRVYAGRLAGGNRLTVRDHSARTCGGMKAGTIEIEERDGAGQARSYAGSW